MNRCQNKACGKEFPSMMGHTLCPFCGSPDFKLDDNGMLAGPTIGQGTEDDRWVDQTEVGRQPGVMIMSPDGPPVESGLEEGPIGETPSLWKTADQLRDDD